MLSCCLHVLQSLTDPLNERLQPREGEAGPGSPPKVRDETHWQAQVVKLNTFGASKSHRHPVVIHQHMCWNLSPSLNIVSCRGPVNAWLFLASARWRTLLAGSAKAHTHTHKAFILQEICSFRRLETEPILIGPLATPKMWKMAIMFACYKSRKLVYCGNWNKCLFLACCLFRCAIWLLWYHAGGMYDAESKDWACSFWCSGVHWHTPTHTHTHTHPGGHFQSFTFLWQQGLNWARASQSGAPPPEVQITSCKQVNLSVTSWILILQMWSQSHANSIYISQNENHEFIS